LGKEKSKTKGMKIVMLNINLLDIVGLPSRREGIVKI
jgi:hypothetical protein